VVVSAPMPPVNPPVITITSDTDYLDNGPGAGIIPQNGVASGLAAYLAELSVPSAHTHVPAPHAHSHNARAHANANESHRSHVKGAASAWGRRFGTFVGATSRR
jgi:hypothetical protein